MQAKMSGKRSSFSWVRFLGPNDTTRLPFFALDSPGGAHSWVPPGDSFDVRFIVTIAPGPAQEAIHFSEHTNRSQRTEPWWQWMVWLRSFLYPWNLSLWLEKLNVLTAEPSQGHILGMRAWGHGGGRVSFVCLMYVDQNRSACSLIVKSEYCSQNNNTRMRKNSTILLRWPNWENSLTINGDRNPGQQKGSRKGWYIHTDTHIYACSSAHMYPYI